MLQAIGTGCGCADDRFRKTSLCSALVIIDLNFEVPIPANEGRLTGGNGC